MRLAVVIPAYEKLADVLHCLNSLRALATDANTIGWLVQDDCSPSVNFPICIPQEIASTVRNERNLGFAANSNIGVWNAIKIFQPDIVLVLNQDVYGVNEWSLGWNESLLSAFDDPAVGIAAPRLLFPDNRIQSVGGVYDSAAQPTHRALGWSNPRAFDEPEDVEWATGAALAIRTGLFTHLHGFDEGYERGYFEDVSLCIRAREAGARIRYQPTCTLIHSVGSTGGSPYFQKNAMRFKNEFVDSGRVKRGTLTPTARYWL